MRVELLLEDLGEDDNELPRFRAAVEVEGLVLHEAIAFSRIGAMAAVAAMTESQLDRALAVHTVTKASLQDVAYAKKRPDEGILFDISGEAS
jgi:hypothetical protein